MNERELLEVRAAVERVARPLTLLALAWLACNPQPPSKHWKGRGVR